MRCQTLAIASIASFVFMGCGPSSGLPEGGDGDMGEDPGPSATLTGVVYAPGNAPGMVPPGHEIPIAGAKVELRTNRPPPIPDGAYCEQCELGGGVTTDAHGRFTIEAVPASYWLVVQKGQFRLERQISVTAGDSIELAPKDTTLPSVHDPDNGQWVPRIAIAPGSYDALEDILGKMRIGEVDADGAYVASSAAGNIEVYANGGNIDSAAGGKSLTDLVSNLDLMLQYHIIFIPCSGSNNVSALQDPQVLRNIRDYVAAGGKLYVTDWSGEWADNVFPEQIELWNGTFSSSVDTPASAYDRAADTWNTGQFGNADGSPSYSSDGAETVEPGLAAWLDGQKGPMESLDEGTYDAHDLVIGGNWDHIDALHTVEIGTDADGAPILDEPTVWVSGDDGRAGGEKPLTVTYEPAGCGRVLFSTYHTTEATHVGLVPQERILLYLIMEIGECTAGPVVD